MGIDRAVLFASIKPISINLESAMWLCNSTLLACALTLLLSPLVAFAQRPPPIDPAYAAEQPEMNAEVIAYETQQFRALLQWHVALDHCEMSKTRLKFLQSQYERQAQLRAAGHSTAENYMLAKYRFEAVKNDIQRFTIEAAQAKASMLVAKMRVMDQGNPIVDYRRDIIKARIDEMSNQIKAQRLMLENIEMEQKLFEGKARNGKVLTRTSSLSLSEADSRVLNAEVALKQAASLRSQIQTNELALKGLELSLERVNREGEFFPAKGLKR